MDPVLRATTARQVPLDCHVHRLKLEAAVQGAHNACMQGDFALLEQQHSSAADRASTLFKAPNVPTYTAILSNQRMPK